MTMRSKEISRIVNAKERIVDAVRERLAVQNKQLSQEERMMAELLEGFDQIAASAMDARINSFTAADLTAWQLFANRTRRQCDEQRDTVARSEVERDATLAEVVLAYQDATRWSVLHTKKQTLENEEVSRNEQRVTDDAAMIRHNRGSRASLQQ